MPDNPDLSPDPFNGPLKPKRGMIVTVVRVLSVLGTIVMLLPFLMPTVRQATPAARHVQCQNNLHQIGLALQNYNAAYGAFPPAYTVDADGKRLHSWRTLLLPFMDAVPRMETLDLTKAWDDPANSDTFNTSIPGYRCPTDESLKFHTTYLAIVAPNSCFRATEPRLLSEITDGPSETLMVIEVDAEHAVHWMAPVDADEQMFLSLGPETKLPHRGGIHAAFADGSMRSLDAKLSAAQRRALISIAGDDK